MIALVLSNLICGFQSACWSRLARSTACNDLDAKIQPPEYFSDSVRSAVRSMIDFASVAYRMLILLSRISVIQTLPIAIVHRTTTKLEALYSFHLTMRNADDASEPLISIAHRSMASPNTFGTMRHKVGSVGHANS